MVVGEIKTLILGAGGMLGTDLRANFPQAISFTHAELDITDKNAVFSIIERLRPELVINAAAYTKVDGCEENIELAFSVNGTAPGYIAEACERIGSKLVHFSTDYVFDGKKMEYTESDKPDPINVYGASKLKGEQAIARATERHYIIRTSWLFGLHGANFVDTMLKLGAANPVVRVVNDQFGKPTYTKDLAQKIQEILNHDYGIYHITNEGVCSWYEFASAIIPNAVPGTSEEFIRRAKRPKYSVLVNTKTKPMRHWKDALRDYLNKTRNPATATLSIAKAHAGADIRH
jgi:dTDP-4-dehydrorhamnose reductase